jgi:hypothetical protein
MLTIVLHLPKCGGTTFSANFRAHLGPRFFHYIAQRDAPTLEHHIETGFRDIDVMMVHNGKFPHHRLPEDLPKRYLALVREPISAAVSMYNFATSATHTNNYERVKDLDFWRFWALTNAIEMWRPNFQTFYMTGRRDIPAAERFLETYQVALYPMSQMGPVYREISGQDLDRSLDRNRAPFFHPVQNALEAAPVPARHPERMIRKADLPARDLALLAELFQTDAYLWERANETGAAAPAPQAPPQTAEPAP